MNRKQIAGYDLGWFSDYIFPEGIIHQGKSKSDAGREI
jgi:hypothetical protein